MSVSINMYVNEIHNPAGGEKNFLKPADLRWSPKLGFSKEAS